MRVLLTGATGLLGWTLLQKMPTTWQVYVALHSNRPLPRRFPHVHEVLMDLTAPEQVRAAAAIARPDVVIHTASIGDLDANEREQAEAWQVNVEGTRALCEATRPYNPYVIFCSTIYVFDGAAPPYAEIASPAPINFYGRCKLAAEEIVRQISSRWLILRPNTTYGWHLPGQRRNWATWLLSKLQDHQAVEAVDDVFNNYVWVGDVADVVLAGIAREATGIVHVGGPQSLSRYAFSLQIADAFGYPRQLIAPAPSSRFSALAPRPRDTTCCIKRMRDELGVHPLSVSQGLDLMRRQETARRQRGSEHHEWIFA
jgi:dTDP-4-dehydrorhamnose reductase